MTHPNFLSIRVSPHGALTESSVSQFQSPSEREKGPILTEPSLNHSRRTQCRNKGTREQGLRNKGERLSGEARMHRHLSEGPSPTSMHGLRCAQAATKCGGR